MLMTSHATALYYPWYRLVTRPLARVEVGLRPTSDAQPSVATHRAHAMFWAELLRGINNCDIVL